VDVSAANDAGLRKERVMMAGWFADPDVALLVQKYFVPVRLRCRPWDFDVDFPTDPLQPLGTKLDTVGAPALVIAKSDGTFVHALGRIGVFAPEIASASLRTALAKAGVRDVPARAGSAAKPPADEVRTFAEEFGLDLDAWTKGATIEFEPSARTTEIDATRQNIEKVLGRAADVLLALQAADGGWPNPAFDIRAIGGRGTQYDYEVARSALAVEALLRLCERLPARKAALEQAARRGLEVVGKFADEPKPLDLAGDVRARVADLPAAHRSRIGQAGGASSRSEADRSAREPAARRRLELLRVAAHALVQHGARPSRAR
jgi:hypothetical protein